MNQGESEYKINNTWEIGTLIDVDLSNQTYFIKIQEENSSKIIEFHNPILSLRKSIKNNSFNKNDKTFKINELVEVWNNQKWMVGNVISQKGNFFLISILSKENPTEKFFHINFIRQLTGNDNMILLNLKDCKKFNLESFQHFSTKKDNYIKRMINKFYKVFTENELQYTFYNGNNLYIFSPKIDTCLVESLIEVSFEHFNEMESFSSCLLEPKEVIKTNNNIKTIEKNEWKTADIVIDKSIFESEKSKIKGNNVKLEMKKIKNSKDDVAVTIKAKDNKSLNESLNILNKMRKYVTVPVSVEDYFFNENNPKGLSYYAKMFEINSISHFKYDDKNTTIGVFGKKNSVEFLLSIIQTFFESQDFKNQKIQELNQIKHEILSYTTQS